MVITQEKSVSSYDRGLLYGDGFFTTAHVRHGEILLWGLHLQRLQTCQQRLNFPQLDWQSLDEYCSKLCVNIAQGVLKIVITRGEGGRGYLPPHNAKPKVIVQTSPYPEHYPALINSGLRLEYAQTRLGHQPLLAGLKTLNRLEQVLIKQEAQQYDCDDVLVEDIAGNVIETSVGNLLCVRDGKVYTPILQNSGILGVYLQHLERNNHIEKVDLRREDLQTMDALFVCNSLMGCVFVRSLDEHLFNLSLARALKSQLESGVL
ncbi:aminodeoxychorismate lyase [Pseudoalteromonas byunsanensis]|uniref:Aminodeoxychorismate lyase n=1 Tax=Pseudoalteromonas byunsanensis TaxID=327939 RepID=A0A1S1N6L2_9GAMM|nr:aminodeoxychorismate lyase [Pseudoalteromonas byunsanensis]OHU96777.1 aminodeoxychorismate lyase [Pseudoalteromonas byunsanensis]